MATYYLQHHGVKGMKWGVRKDRKGGGLFKRKQIDPETQSDDYKTSQTLKKKHISQMSNKELQSLNQRLQLEQQYANLTQKKSKGKEIATAILTEVVKETAKNSINSLLKGEQPAVMKGYKKVESFFKSENVKKNVAAAALAAQIQIGARKAT